MINHRKRGATSILVIIMMVVLLVLGLAILTTSLSGVRLAQKKQDWLQSYYKLEEQGAYAQASLDLLLAPVIEQAVDSTVTSDTLTNLTRDHKPGTVSFKETGDNRWDATLQVDDNTTKPIKHLTIVLDLNFNSPRGERINLVSYRQWQDPFEFVALPGFDDPLFETPEFNLEDAAD